MKKNIGRAGKVSRMEVPNAVLLGQVRQMLNEGHTVTINVKGYSMRPFLENGRDKVKLVQPQAVQTGDAVLAEISAGTYVLHRVVRIKEDEVVLMGDGNLRGTEHCRKENIVGVVTHYFRKGKSIEAKSPWLRRSVTLWRHLLPVRRYLLYIYRIKLKLSNGLK